MKLVRSNRPEALADALAERVRAAPLPPTEKEVIVVQSRGMERWLTMALSERLGIWANPWMPFPRSLIEWVLEKLEVGSAEETKAFGRSQLKWTVAELLREAPPHEITAYLEDQPDDERLLRLATSVAAVFDDYVMYRPDLLEEWAQGKHEGWQSDLWSRVIDTLGRKDLAARIEAGVDKLRAGTSHASLPERLHLFAPETLPPLLMGFFRELSSAVDTTVYSLEPSREYIGDVASKAERVAAGPEQHDGHSFLVDTGRLARDFQQLLHAEVESAQEERDAFRAPGRDTLLHALQSDILDFERPPRRDARTRIRTDDNSISIHACTGPMREAQVLYDLVRGVLEDDPSISPKDIVVMTPDLDAYAPAFRAVFGEQGTHRIPFEVHDRRTRDDAAFYDDFLTILEVLDSRFSVLDFVRLLDTSSLREDFRFTQDERSRLTDLLSAAGVRWGVDAAHRAELGFPEDPHHTWRAGLDRLFLGFASPPDSVDVFEGVLPRGAPSLGDAELVARLSELARALFDTREWSRHPHAVDDWSRALGALATKLFSETDEVSPAALTLREQLDAVRALSGDGGYHGKVSLKTFRRELAALLVDATPAQGFLRRGVTFTGLVPLRSVPFKVVCLVGMSEDAFPRKDDRPSFDFTRDGYRLGDRNKRDDDRHSFLQAVLCAHERLIITYSAPAASQRTEPNPSPIVWELQETLRRYYVPEADGELLEPVKHRLHAFDAAYYTPGELPRSFSDRYAALARAVYGDAEPAPRLVLKAEPGKHTQNLSARELASWLWRPIATFIDRVLVARFDVEELYEPTGALVEIGRLATSKVGNEALREGLASERLSAYLESSPEFPDGSWGRMEQRQLEREIRAIAAAERRLLAGETPGADLFEVEVGGVTVEARLGGLLEGRRVVTRFTKPGRKAELQAWVEHLLMQSVEEAESRTTQLVLRGERERPLVVSFAPVERAQETLAGLVDLYRRSREEPLPLIERASRELADLLVDDEKKAWTQARKAYTGQTKWDPRLAFVFRSEVPFDDAEWAEAFQEAAWALYAPLLRHRSEA